MPNKKNGFKLSSVIWARCPACHQGKVTDGLFSIHKECSHCHYNFHPEPGFYLGAMAVGFFFTALVTVPPTIVLKVLNVDLVLLITFPFVEFLFVGTFLLFYCRILWLHLEYQMTRRLDGNPPTEHHL